MANGYTRQSSANIVDGNYIYASYFNAEYNKIESAFDASNGHNHDGSTGGGSPINILDTTNTLTITRGGTGATTAAAARGTLGLVIGTDVQAWNSNLDTISALTHGNGNIIVSDGTNWVVESGSTARDSLGLGSIATQDSSNVSITGGTITAVTITGSTISGGTITGITDIAVADGGTGASTAAGARTNLDVYSTSEVDNAVDNAVNSAESTLTAYAEGLVDDLSGVNDQTAARSSLGLGSAATQADTKYLHRSNNLSDVQNAATARANLGVAGPEAAYPVGSIYLNASNGTNPATLLGFGTWSKIASGRVLLGADGTNYNAGDVGGAETHTLSESEMPSHDHYFSGTTSSDTHNHSFPTYRRNSGSSSSGVAYNSNDSTFQTNISTTNDTHSHTVAGNTDTTGSGEAHNNMQPYLAVHIWQRTA